MTQSSSSSSSYRRVGRSAGLSLSLILSDYLSFLLSFSHSLSLSLSLSLTLFRSRGFRMHGAEVCAAVAAAGCAEKTYAQNRQRATRTEEATSQKGDAETAVANDAL
jgi:hypothetical protein